MKISLITSFIHGFINHRRERHLSALLRKPRSFLIPVIIFALFTIQTSGESKTDSALPAEGLVFKKPFQTFRPDPSATSVESIFEFTNESDHPITIEKIKTSCGCTTAALEQKTYSPGESGEIKASFNMGNRRGLQKKTIRVATDDPSNPETVLTLEVIISEILKLSPRFVAWERGEAGDPKTITLTAAENIEEINITEVTCPDNTFKLELAVIDPGKKSQVTITPLRVDRSRNALIRIKTDFPKNDPKIFHAHVFIR